MVRTVKTLDDLTNAVHSLGYIVSRRALYLCPLPHSQTSIQGRKNVSTLPVKLVRPQNDLRRKHPDRMFCSESSKAADAIAKYLGPKACLYISQDDKSSVPLGRTAAKVQAPILMSMRAKVRLPDHDFRVGPRHLLVPSVMAECSIDEENGVGYCGETYVAIRSSKHNNSSAFSHQQDLRRMKVLLPEIFRDKAVLIKSVDGGPDENPRFVKNQLMNIKTFKVLHQNKFHFSQNPKFIRTWTLTAASSSPRLQAFLPTTERRGKCTTCRRSSQVAKYFF